VSAALARAGRETAPRPPGPVAVLGRAFQATLPVVVGYVPLGMAFGLLFVEHGHPWTAALAMSVLVYAGSAQFLAVGLLAAGAGLAEIGVATLILNARHAFFGVSLLDRWRGIGPRKAYLVFALTDETYALISSLRAPPGVRETTFHLAIAGINQAAWVSGTALGALLGGAAVFDTTGLDFALTALFTVLVVEQARALRTPFPFLLAATVGLAALALWGGGNMLLISIAASLALLAAHGWRRGWR
jgi:4-azaleucine resistance transporter AzlC